MKIQNSSYKDAVKIISALVLVLVCSFVFLKFINGDFFSIKGKWICISEGTFKDNVVVFTDTNCNIYSPNDTYVLRKENGTMKLYITDILGSDNVYDINIISRNQIEIDEKYIYERVKE